MSSQYVSLPGKGSDSWKAPVATAAALPVIGNNLGDAIAVEDTGVIYVWTGTSWSTAVAGVGTVTSVSLVAPSSILNVTGTPITGAGTFTLSLASQADNTVFAGPISGGAVAPTFRLLDHKDLPLSMFYQGVWAGSATQYFPNDVVTYNGQSYIALLKQHGATPDSGAPYWVPVFDTASITRLILPESVVGVPAYAFSETGNDTGMGSPSDGVIEFSTNGSLGMSLQASGLTVTGTISASNFPTTGNANTVAGFSGSGALESIPGWNIDTTTGGPNINITQQPNNTGGGNMLLVYTPINPIGNSPNENYNILSSSADIDQLSAGFTLGTNGNAVNGLNVNIRHHGLSHTGNLTAVTSYFDLGDGTNPVTINALQYYQSFANIRNGVTITNQIQGYMFQPQADAGAIIQNQTIGFGDFPNFACAVPGYQSFSAGINLAEISNNYNYNGLNLSGNLPLLSGNAGYFGVSVTPIIGTINSGTFQGLNVNPTITNNKGNATGLYVNMNNVTNFAGAQSFIAVQDITYTINTFGDSNNFQIEYTNTVLAGSEVATLVGNVITVQIQSGVSTATQVAAAIAANFTLNSNLTTVITGTAGNAQTAFGPTNFAGGSNPGQKYAADLTGDVRINGALSFTGGLSIGQLSSFATQDLALMGPGVNSIDTLITQPTLAANVTSTGKDLLAINTAMLLTTGANSHITTSFLGIAALGLPAVVSMGAGATIDRVEGAVFAISLDSGATGGTIDEVDLCRALAIPNGVTTVTKLIAYEFDLPFGDPGTTTWGVYMKPPTAHNFMAGDLKVGSGSDVPANSSVGIELESTVKAFLPSRMTTTERNALTAINGMVLYNLTTDKLQVYAAGVWVDLH